MNVADGYAEVMRTAAEAVKPDPELRLDEWSEDHVVIPPGNSFEGPYRLEHTPMARRILQCLSPTSEACRIVCKIASQMLKTQVFLCAALGWIDGAPANILALEPNDNLTKRLSARFSQAAEHCEKVQDKLAPVRSRDARNTVGAKDFKGGTLYIATAGADANLAEISARYLFCDEVNREGWRPKSRNEGSKVKLAEARLTTYEGISKSYIVSSPTDEGASEIDDWYELGTQEGYYVPCPHCGGLQELVLENFRFTYDAERNKLKTRPCFVCPHPGCGELIFEHHKDTMLPDVEMGGQARWIASAEGDGDTVSFRLSAFYAPLGSITWARLAKELGQAKRMAARGDHSALKVFYNTRLGLCYTPAQSNSSVKALMDRAKAEQLAPRVVPDEALVLTMWTDTQPTRLESVIQAWGPGMENWVVDHQILWGSPTDPPDQPGSVWQRLDALRATPLPHASGTLIYISADGIDTGGANTQDVYNYVMARGAVNCLATKGANVRNKPVIASKPTLQDVDWQGNRVADGVKLWLMGTDTAKDHIFNRMPFVKGPGAMHFHREITEEFIKQVLAERVVVRHVKGHAVRDYVKPNGVKNEGIDTLVGNLAMAYHLGINKWSPHDWAALRQNLVPRSFTPDLFAQADVALAAEQAPLAEAAPGPAADPADCADQDAAEQQDGAQAADSPHVWTEVAGLPPVAFIKPGKTSDGDVDAEDGTPSACEASAPASVPPAVAPAPISPPAAVPQPTTYAPAFTGRRMLSRGIR